VLEKVQLNDSNQNEGVVWIEIVYRVKSTNSRFNFVFPFYKLEGTDINLALKINQLADGA
jgi:flagellar motor switch protein FliM